MPKKSSLLASIDKCTGCLACADVCPHDAIKVIQKWNLLYPIVDADLCVNCHLCTKVCPVVSPQQNCHDFHSAKAVAAWSNSDGIRTKAASGGFCTTMALDMIRKGGKVALCNWKDSKATFILTDDKQEILQAENSKYIQSDAHGIYKQVQKTLLLGTPVLFIGHPCQVGGLYGFLRNKKYDHLTTIEFICSPPPSPEAIYIQESVTKGKLLHFRCKNSPYYWQNDYNVVLQTEEGVQTISKKEGVFYPIFASLLTARYACMNCQYAKPDRCADYTVGDFHGYRTEGWEKGISLVICNTSDAYNDITRIKDLSFETTTLSRALSSNHRLITGWEGVRYHPANVFRSCFNAISPKIRQCFLINRYPYRLLWLIFKFPTKINIIIKKRSTLKIYTK